MNNLRNKLKSRLPRFEAEKEFAAFLESKGRTWVYEPCSLDTGVPCEILDQNQVYIPDFWCKEDGCYYEVSASKEAYLLSMAKIEKVLKLQPELSIKLVNPNGTSFILSKHLISEYLPEELFDWANDYVARKRIRGPKGNISFSELLRRLLEKERKKDVKQNDPS